MSVLLPPNSADWDSVGDTYYRKQEIYRMGWSVNDLSAYRIVGALLAGPLGVPIEINRFFEIVGLHLSSSLNSFASSNPLLHSHHSRYLSTYPSHRSQRQSLLFHQT